MEGLEQVARSLSPYVVISLEGDPIKTYYASTWAELSPMPNVWVKKYITDDKTEIIANIWDIPSGRDRSAIMIPNSRVDHCIIFYDLNYRSMKLKGTTRDLDVFIRENKTEDKGPSLQVIIHGCSSRNKEEAEVIEVCKRNNISFLLVAGPDIVKNVCYRIYGQRAAVIDNQIKSMLNASK